MDTVFSSTSGRTYIPMIPPPPLRDTAIAMTTDGISLASRASLARSKPHVAQCPKAAPPTEALPTWVALL